MLLQSHDTYDAFGLMNEADREMKVYSRAADPDRITADRIDGFFANVAGEMCSIFRINADLSLRIGDREFSITPDVSSIFRKEKGRHVIALLRGSETLIRFAYEPPELPVPPELDPTPSVQYEDFDFFYFVHSVLSDPGRRERIFRNL